MKALPNEVVDYVGTPMQSEVNPQHSSGPVHYVIHSALQLQI
jgi:hypothetical protein